MLPHSLHGIFINYIDYESPRCFSRPSTQKPAIDCNLDFLPGYAEDFDSIVDHCNGLLLYESDMNLCSYVVNPATRQWGRLHYKTDHRHHLAYLAFDPAVSPHYEDDENGDGEKQMKKKEKEKTADDETCNGEGLPGDEAAPPVLPGEEAVAMRLTMKPAAGKPETKKTLSSPADDPDYSYVSGTKLGPENWAKLSPKYSACNGGAAARKQAPIDIMTFNGKPGGVTIGGKAFSLKKLRWKTPSEHTINGKRHPVEVQLVHESDAGSGELAIIAILYKVGAPDSFYFQLKRKLAELAAGRVHLRSLEKRTGSYFRYMGSLTAPPCAENVYWNVLGKVRQMTKEQIDLVTAPLPAAAKQNARPVQPLNGRVVTFYNPPNSTISFDM
ncbi:hypothetical protein TRIUR3_34073 [Triticum urartu]|uniref:Uncharacterized protein n=1 Tax=Triticum urartu TaxID=4572 RepID=M7YGQ3_TRIUA|nr:hypothetical protein TRIUR3_34073 [Triticum urartu]